MTTTVTPPPVATGGTPLVTSPPRMAWLDALRGLAALVVAWYHLSPSVIGTARHAAVHHYIDLGKYGVLLFFLVSGYVIPMSLERHGSLRRFWAGRLFRIYPAFLFAAAVIVTLAALDVIELPPTVRAETATTVLGHATMLQEFLGVRGLVWPFWTLSFEMVFYLVVAGLFGLGLHRLSAWWSAGLALVALVAGTALPDHLLGATAGGRRLTAVILVAAAGLSVAAYLSGRRRPVLVASVAGLCFLALPLTNGHATRWSTASSSWQAALMLAIMFAGTVIYRLQHRQINRLAGAAALAVVLLCSAGTTWVHSGRGADLLQWTIGTVAVSGTFALGFTLRHRRIPAFIAWLGAASYSVYLLHIVMLYALVHLYGPPASTADRVILVFSFAFLTLGAAWFAHRYVERTGQTLGRHVQRYLETALGPDSARRSPATTPSAGPGTGSIVAPRRSV